MVSLTFERPEYLWLLFAVPIVVIAHVYFLRNAKKRALAFANFAVLKRATGERYVTKNHLLLALRIAIMLLAILAVSRAVVWYTGDANENEYVLAIDTSASMAAQDLAPDRLGAATAAAGSFLDALDTDTRTGVVSFSGVSFIESPLTTDRGALRDALGRLKVEASGTDIPGAIITSVNLLIPSERGRSIILISDGSNTIETFEDRGLKRATDYAVQNRVRISAIGVGEVGAGPIGYLPTFYNVSATYNVDTLQEIANRTGGKYYDATDKQALQDAYDAIRAGDVQSTLSYDATGILMGLAICLLVLEWILANTRFRSLP